MIVSTWALFIMATQPRPSVPKGNFPTLDQAVPLHWDIVAIHPARRLESRRGDAMLHAGLPDHGSAASSCCLVLAKCHLVQEPRSVP